MKLPDIEDVSVDFTPMIDVVFLLIIFFILMPPKEMEGRLQSYLPKEGGGKPPPGPPPITFGITLRSEKISNEEIETRVLLNQEFIDSFKTNTVEMMDRIFSMEGVEKEERLTAEYKRDEAQLTPADSDVLKKLNSKLRSAAEASPEKYNTDVIIDAESDVPFKIVLAILNSATGLGFEKLKFTAPPPEIWAEDQ